MVGEIKFVHDLLDRRLTLLHLPRCGSKVSHMVINNVISHCPMYIGPLMLQYIKVSAKFFFFFEILFNTSSKLIYIQLYTQCEIKVNN